MLMKKLTDDETNVLRTWEFDRKNRGIAIGTAQAYAIFLRLSTLFDAFYQETTTSKSTIFFWRSSTILKKISKFELDKVFEQFKGFCFHISNNAMFRASL